ncbi:Ig-like domain-containing protein [Lachnospiraceae bacterium C1.1]|nr:Ig-like domain-containing protein [Lachnospiraceae bacterium C1.1]
MFKFRRLRTSRLMTAVLSAALVFSCTPSLTNAYASTETVTTAASSSISFSESEGYEEGLYAEWAPVTDAAGYKAYYSADGSSYTKLDNELIRSYGTYMRADAVGLSAGSYYLKVEAIDSEGNIISSKTTDKLTVIAYDRSGFAFSDDSAFSEAPGAYNLDGTLKDGAKVIYVTAENVKTISTDVIKDAKGGTETYTGMQSIIARYEKGYDTTPIAFRIIGELTYDDMDTLLSDEGLQIKGPSKTAVPMNITIEGIGEDGCINGFGILARYARNLELRNFAVYNCLDDCISIDTGNTDIWVHDLDLFYGQPGSDSDQVKGDGSVDIKGDSKFITVAYNHFWDSGKCSLCGMTSETGPNYITYHHNWFDHSDSRHPRVRTMSVHVYNNYFDGNSKYGIGATTSSNVFAESNYFRNCKFPMLSSLQGNDVYSGTSKYNVNYGTFSSEAGGSIKAYNNTIVDTNNTSSFIPYGASTYLMKGTTTSYSTIDTSKHFDAYEVSSRTATVPSSVTTVKGGYSYNNFDTDGSVDLAVDESNIDSPDEKLVAKIEAQAGRVNGGDLQFSFDNDTEDTNSSIIAKLKSAVSNYSSSLVSVGGIDASIVSDDSSTDDSSSSEDSEETSSENEKTDDSSEVVSYSRVLNASDLTVGEYSEDFTAGDNSFFTITASENNVVKVDASKKTYNDISFTQRLKTGGAGSYGARSIAFTTEGSGKVTVYAASSSSKEARVLNFGTASDGELIAASTADVSNSGICTCEFEFSKAGTYYLYSESGGINFYYVDVEYTNSDDSDSSSKDSSSEDSSKDSTEDSSSEDSSKDSSENSSSDDSSSSDSSKDSSNEDSSSDSSEDNTSDNSPVSDDSNDDSNDDSSSSDNSQDSSVSDNESTVSEASVIAGGKLDISDKISGAVRFKITDKSQKKIASVTKKGIVKAKKKKSGEVTITGYHKVAGKYVAIGSYTVKVVAPVLLQKTVTATAVGETISANDIISCEGFEVSSWSSSNKSVAVVSNTGLVRTLKKGSSKITATFISGGKKIKYRFKVTVK